MGFFNKKQKQEELAKRADAKATASAKTPADKGVSTAEVKADAKPVSRGPLAREGAGASSGILIRPVLTEKADRQQALGKYAFIVSRAANKVEVAKAVRDLYGVKPASVRIVNVKGKEVRFGRVIGRRQDVKKAVVTLKSGETLSFEA